MNKLEGKVEFTAILSGRFVTSCSAQFFQVVDFFCLRLSWSHIPFHYKISTNAAFECD